MFSNIFNLFFDYYVIDYPTVLFHPCVHFYLLSSNECIFQPTNQIQEFIDAPTVIPYI